jgi:hypothetical protein
MAQNSPQTLSNHAQIDPLFHFFLIPVFFISWIVSVVQCIRDPGLLSGWMVVFMAALLVAAFKIRLYALKVQDRLIRLEERLRLSTALPDHLRSQIPKLTEKQLIAIRFASDEEVPTLVERTLAQNLLPKAIKTSIRNWRPDYWRV